MLNTVLLVEDDDRLRRVLASWLSYAGYRVTQAPDGETAISVMQRMPFAVVLTDIVMGDVDGLDVLRSAQQLTNRPVVILLTGQGSLESAVAAVRAGAHDYLVKPCDEDELVRCLQSAVQRYTAEQHLRETAQLLVHYALGADRVTLPERLYPPQSQQMLRVGAIMIGASRQHVWFHERPVQLTPIEFEMLRFLAGRPHQVLRYTEIVRQTHKLEVSDVEAKGLLRTHFLNLRRKFDSRYFVAERGIGYMLVVPQL